MRAVRKTLLMVIVAITAILLGNRGLFAQTNGAASDSAYVRGTVTGKESGLPLQYAFISIPAIGIEIFANEQGRFVFSKLRVGTYHVRVRQLGYVPLEVDVVVTAQGMQELALQMSRLATKLTPMQVMSEWVCAFPGRPGFKDGKEVVEVFEQLEQNAARLQLLSKQYPFVLLMKRQFLLHKLNDTDSLEKSDVTAIGSMHTPYRVGNIVREVRDRSTYKQAVMQLPTLFDFADRDFQRNHCFKLRGVEEVDSVPFIRVDFKAAARINDPDVDGTVYLDTANFRLRRAVTRLTRIPSGFKGLVGVEVITRYTDIRPGLPVIASVYSRNEFQSSAKWPFSARIEVQVATEMQYLKGRPDSVRVPGRPPQLAGGRE